MATLTGDLKGLEKASNSVRKEQAKMDFAQFSMGMNALTQSLSQVEKAFADLSGAYQVQETAETKLTTVMQQRMGATAAEVQSIKDLCSAQQEIGVIGDEVQLSGAQQIATFLKQKESIETLLPAMNNLLAQQKGLEASAGDAQNVGNLMGKAMMGQVDALKRVGITFTEAQAEVMKYGTEQERASMLAEIITQNVGNMNAALAQTESGRQQQVANALGDIKEQLGSMVTGAMPFITIASQAGTALMGLASLGNGVVSVTGGAWPRCLACSLSPICNWPKPRLHPRPQQRFSWL